MGLGLGDEDEMKVLFICNQNQNRSKTAEELFKDRFETKSAGLFNSRPVTEKEINWADTIVVMEQIQREELSKRFPKHYIEKRIVSLNIDDSYYYQQPKLVNILKEKMEELL